MLTAYRVGVAELWSALVAAARGLPDVPADDVIDLAGAVFAVQNTYSDAALAAYRDEAQGDACARRSGSGPPWWR